MRRDDLGSKFLEATIEEFERYKTLGDGSLRQLPDPELIFRRPEGEMNCLGVLMKHIGGNLRSRWTDFLSTDGEKPDRNRDSEFRIELEDTVDALSRGWEEGWAALFSTLRGLRPADLEKEITIRSEPLSVPRAMTRSLSHTSYHVGQIVLMCHSFVGGEWKWLSIAPNQSAQYNASMARK